MNSRARLLTIFGRIADGNLRALVAELVQIHAEHSDSGRTPRSHYKAKIDSYVTRFGAQLDDTYLDVPLEPDEGPATNLTSSEERGSTQGASVTLESISLRNFGSYCGTESFDLAPNGDRNVTAVVGSNGDGKTTLFIALNWAMYGDTYADELQREHGRRFEDLVSRSALAQGAKDSMSVTTEVTLHFSIRGTNYYVTRSLTSNPRVIDGEITYSVHQEPTILRKVDASGNHGELLPSALPSLLSKLPSHVRDFYLFDGERINRFVAPGSQALIRGAIRRVVGIEALEKTAEDIGGVSAEFRREARDRSTGELASVRDDLNQKQGLKAELRRTVESKNVELLELRSRVGQLDEFLRNSVDTRPLQERRTDLEKQIKDLRLDEERMVFEIRDLAAAASLLLGGDSVSRLVKDLDEQRVAGMIPGPISRHLLNDLLELNRCICGTDLSAGSAARIRLESELQTLGQQAQESEFKLSLFFELGAINNQLVSKAENLDKRRTELARVIQRRQEAHQTLAEVTSKLEGIEIVDRSGWERERANTRRLEVQTEATIQNASARLIELDSEITALRRKEESLESSQADAKYAALKRDWSEAAEEALRRVFQDYAAEARKVVRAATEQLWKSLLPSVYGYTVDVTDDFELQVFDNVGTASISGLAMGQQQCLGLAFITAIAQVAESRPPLVIDMPFGRLDAEVAASVAAALPTLTEQLILFVLPDTEWNSKTRSAIQPYLAREYWIQFEPESGCTRFIPARRASI